MQFYQCQFFSYFFSFQMQTASTLSRKFSAAWTSSLCARQSESAIVGSSLSVVEKLGSSLSYICVNCENVGSFAFSMTNGKTDHTLFGCVFLLCLDGLLNMNCKTFQKFSPSLSIFNQPITGIKKLRCLPTKKTVLNTRGTGRAESAYYLDTRHSGSSTSYVLFSLVWKYKIAR